MNETVPQVLYRELQAGEIDAIGPLWQKLKEHHASLSQRWSNELQQRAFEPRKQKLLAKAQAGKLKIDVASTTPGAPPLAYCISSISSDREGEIDSLYVESEFRGRGIGTELMRRALNWLDASGAASKTVSVFHVNDEALEFYTRFGFHPRTVQLRQCR